MRGVSTGLGMGQDMTTMAATNLTATNVAMVGGTGGTIYAVHEIQKGVNNGIEQASNSTLNTLKHAFIPISTPRKKGSTVAEFNSAAARFRKVSPIFMVPHEKGRIYSPERKRARVPYTPRRKQYVTNRSFKRTSNRKWRKKKKSFRY